MQNEDTICPGCYSPQTIPLDLLQLHASTEVAAARGGYRIAGITRLPVMKALVRIRVKLRRFRSHPYAYEAVAAETSCCSTSRIGNELFRAAARSTGRLLKRSALSVQKTMDAGGRAQQT